MLLVWAVGHDYCDVSKKWKRCYHSVRWLGLGASGDALEKEVHHDDALPLATRPMMATIADDDWELLASCPMSRSLIALLVLFLE